MIASVPHHPFLERAIKSLERYNLRWPTPYITIMSSTGPLYFSILWRQHNTNRRHMAEDERVRLLWPDEYMGKDWSFFSHHEGNSWHQWDAELMFWVSFFFFFSRPGRLNLGDTKYTKTHTGREREIEREREGGRSSH